MVHRLARLASLVLIACSLLPRLSAAVEADSPFAQASAAFERGDYRAALAQFEALRAAGADGPSIPFNIGVCRYKLGEYAAAEAEFDSLAQRFPAMRALAEYNRGLALEGLERRADARAAFVAASEAGDDKIASLASARVGEIDALAARARPPWQGFVQLGVGHDDNVALVDELTLPGGVQADSPLAELLGFGSGRLGTRARVDVAGYFVRYSDASEFDEDALSAAVAFERSRGAWAFEIGPRYERSTIGGAAFESETGLRARADRPFGAGLRFTAAFAYDDVAALEPQFDYLEGARRQLRLTLERRTTSARYGASLEAEDNNRAEPAVSSDRLRVVLRYARALGALWDVEGAVAYRSSRYERPTGPDERLAEVIASARRLFASGWAFTADYRHSNNDADLPEFSYTADRIAVSLSRTF